jgi:radical SAM protein with 4Fe4S-binding SPASM domain
LTNYYRTHYRHDDGLFLTARQIERLNSIVRELRTELAWPEMKCNAGSRDFTTAGARSPEEWKARSSCSGGFSNCVILPNGDVILCEQSPHTAEFVVGNLKKQSLLDVWNSQALMDFIVPDRRRFAGTACFDCDEFDSCHRLYGRCFRDAYFTYGGIYTPSPNCPRAPAGIRMA